MRARIITLAVLAVMAMLVGCSSDSGSDSTVVTETVTTEAPGAEAAADEAVAEEAPAEEEPVAEPESGGEIEVPDVVGEDHQLAQDTMQAAGLYNLSEEDATGQGRMLVIDRNWTVVAQSPPAGTMVSEDETIVLESKKDDE